MKNIRIYNPGVEEMDLNRALEMIIVSQFDHPSDPSPRPHKKLTEPSVGKKGTSKCPLAEKTVKLMGRGEGDIDFNNHWKRHIVNCPICRKILQEG